MKKNSYSLIVRNFTFGVEDSLVSTVGLLAGIAVAGVGKSTIIVTGLVLIFVEAFSMAIGSLISEQSVEEYEQKREVSLVKPALAAAVMLVSYIVAGLIPLAPYGFMQAIDAVWVSVSLTMLSLFFLGALNAKLFKLRVWRAGIQTLILGGLAIAVGIIVGQLASHI